MRTCWASTRRAAAFDYFGLNHLGWLREVFRDGEPQLPRLWQDPSLVARVYRAPIFDPAFLQTLRLLPTEYLYYYYFPRIGDRATSARPDGRGLMRSRQLNDQLFRDLAVDGADRRQVYEQYLARTERRLHADRVRRRAADRAAAVGGAHRLRPDRAERRARDSLQLERDHSAQRRELRRAAETSRMHDIVEVPCVVNANGARPLNVRPMPEQVRELLVRVKEYERLTVAAATMRSLDAASARSRHNPLVAETGARAQARGRAAAAVVIRSDR